MNNLDRYLHFSICHPKHTWTEDVEYVKCLMCENSSGNSLEWWQEMLKDEDEIEITIIPDIFGFQEPPD